MKKCKNLVFLASCLAVSAVAVGAAKLNFNVANAESPIAFTGEQTLYVDDSGELYTTETANATQVDFKLEMAYGAAVRTVEGEGNGLRFKTYVNANAYDALSSAVEAGNFSMGALIGPSYLVGEQLTFEDDEETYQDVVQTEKGWSSQTTNGNYAYYSAIYDVPTAVLNMNFTAQSYAKFTLANGETLFVYAKNAEKQEGDTQNANVRSVKYIADMALADPAANLNETQEEILTDLQAMKEDGVTFNASVTGATATTADQDGAYGSVYTATFDGTNALSFGGANYNEFKVKFSATLTLDDMTPTGKVTLMRNGAFVSEVPEGEWVNVIVEGNTFSVNKAVTATVYDVKECTGYWLARNEKYLLNLVGGIDASKLTVGTTDDQIYYHIPGPIKKNATYQGVQENVAFKKYNVETYGEAKTAHVWSYSATYVHYAGPQMYLTSALTKAELQTLVAAGYKTLNFQFATRQSLDQNKQDSDYYLLDFAKIKAMLESSENMEAARATVTKSFTAWATTAHNDYMTNKYAWDDCNWKTVTYSIDDLITCYELLDLLPLFYEVVSFNPYNVYITDFTFTKA